MNVVSILCRVLSIMNLFFIKLCTSFVYRSLVKKQFKLIKFVVFSNSPNSPNSNASSISWMPSQSSLVPFTLEGQSDKYFESEDTSKGIIPVYPKDINSNKVVEMKSIKPISPEAQRYFSLIQKLAPNDMIAKFAQSAPKHVQEAAKSTIMTIFGSLPSYALDAALITTNTKLANLLFQMQITGYMFKNAEYRMSLTKSLRGLPKLPELSSIKQGNFTLNPLQDVSRFEGKVQIQTSNGNSIEVDVNDLTYALSREVADLRSELNLIRSEREKELRSNLLTYIQALEDKELSRLTSDMSPEVMDSIKMLVNALMEKMGVDNTNMQEVVIQQSVGMLAQLCMWQLVTGYKLREYEALDKGASFE